MTTEIAQRIAERHGLRIEAHELCVVVYVPWSSMSGRSGIAAIPAWDYESLRIALGY